MDFTGAEFFRGNVAALVAFNVLFVLGGVGLPAVVDSSAGRFQLEHLGGIFFVLMISLPVSGFACLTYGALSAWLLGKLLRGQRRRWVHRIAFTALGAAVGYVSMIGFSSELGRSPEKVQALDPSLLAFVIPAALAVLIGWEYTSRRALRADAVAPQPDAPPHASQTHEPAAPPHPQ